MKENGLTAVVVCDENVLPGKLSYRSKDRCNPNPYSLQGEWVLLSGQISLRVGMGSMCKLDNC